jgi:hypothetical protein
MQANAHDPGNNKFNHVGYAKPMMHILAEARTAIAQHIAPTSAAGGRIARFYSKSM